MCVHVCVFVYTRSYDVTEASDTGWTWWYRPLSCLSLSVSSVTHTYTHLSHKQTNKQTNKHRHNSVTRTHTPVTHKHAQTNTRRHTSVTYTHTPVTHTNKQTNTHTPVTHTNTHRVGMVLYRKSVPSSAITDPICVYLCVCV